MRKITITALALVALAASGALSLSLTSAASASATAAHPRQLNLHDARLARQGHTKPGKIGGIVYARGHQPKAARTGSSCGEPNCPLIYNGGPVQHNPHVYLLLWGPNWTTDSSQSATAAYTENLLRGLGTQPDSWSTINSQYGDGSGVPTFSGSVFQGVFQDTSTPPTGVGQGGLAAEADAFAASQGISDLADAQIVIATQSGTCPAGFHAPGCNGGSGYYCAWHSSSNEPYTNLPYIPDAGAGCGADFVNSNGPLDGVSIVEGHEYAETITDPQPESGWWDANDNSGGEIGDKCAWTPSSADVTLPTGTFAMQPLYSNAASSSGKCVMSSTAPQYATNPVSGLKASPRYTQITATWSASKNATSYRLRLRTASGTLVTQATVTGASYIFHNLKALHTYVVNVLANPAAPGATTAKVTTKTK